MNVPKFRQRKSNHRHSRAYPKGTWAGTTKYQAPTLALYASADIRPLTSSLLAGLSLNSHASNASALTLSGAAVAAFLRELDGQTLAEAARRSRFRQRPPPL